MSDLNLSISKELIEPIIREKIHAAVIEAFGGSTIMLDKVIDAALNIKVDNKGNSSGYSSDIPFIQWFCREAIMDCAKQALKEFVDEQKPAITEAVKRQLTKSRNAVARSFVDGLAASINNQYLLTVKISLSDRD